MIAHGNGPTLTQLKLLLIKEHLSMQCIDYGNLDVLDGTPVAGD